MKVVYDNVNKEYGPVRGRTIRDLSVFRSNVKELEHVACGMVGGTVRQAAENSGP
jgi:hypothetical protein